MNKAVFLDRDGVINKNRVDYVKNWGEFIFLPFALDALQLWTKNEFSIFIMTNQSCIARKILTKDELTAIHEKMLKEIEAADGNITYIYYCPHKPEDNCDCRKPKQACFFRQSNNSILIY